MDFNCENTDWIKLKVDNTKYNIQPGNEMGLFYNDPEPTWGILYALNSLQVCMYALVLSPVHEKSRFSVWKNKTTEVAHELTTIREY